MVIAMEKLALSVEWRPTLLAVVEAPRKAVECGHPEVALWLDDMEIQMMQRFAKTTDATQLFFSRPGMAAETFRV